MLRLIGSVGPYGVDESYERQDQAIDCNEYDCLIWHSLLLITENWKYRRLSPLRN